VMNKDERDGNRAHGLILCKHSFSAGVDKVVLVQLDAFKAQDFQAFRISDLQLLELIAVDNLYLFKHGAICVYTVKRFKTGKLEVRQGTAERGNRKACHYAFLLAFIAI